jgi:hypothetical protein
MTDGRDGLTTAPTGPKVVSLLIDTAWHEILHTIRHVRLSQRRRLAPHSEAAHNHDRLLLRSSDSGSNGAYSKMERETRLELATSSLEG